MKFLGNILHLSNSGRLIAKSSQSPPSGAFIFNKDKKKIGKIVDVFGPTKEPYISIGIFKSIGTENFKNCSGEDLFVSNNPKNRKKSRFNKNIKKNREAMNNKNSKNSKTKRFNKK
jgi:RNA-binding protein